jgi:hypothetical protein
MAQYRAEVSAGGRSEDDEGGYWDGVAMACKEPFTWMFAAMHFALILMQSFKDFLPSVRSLTLDSTRMDSDRSGRLWTHSGSRKSRRTLSRLRHGELANRKPVRTSAIAETDRSNLHSRFVAYIVTLVVSWHSGRVLEHCWHIVACILVSLAGAVIMIATLNTGARYFAVFLLCSGPFVGLNIQISWETTVVPRPRTKRAALIAIANCVSSATHWFSPYFFLRSQEPRYELGGGIIIVGAGLTIISCMITRWWAMRKNAALKRQEDATGIFNEWRYAT